MVKRTALVLLVALFASGCSSSGNRIVIGSKNFTEQFILAELVAQHLERKTSLKVERRLNLGGTLLCDRALRSGEIDLYVEYTGTAWGAILKRPPKHDSQEVYRLVKEEYARQGLEWREPLGFNNTFTILIRSEDAQRLNLRTLSEVARYTPEWKAGFGYEFLERADGFRGLAETYGLKFAKPPRVMDLGLSYRALADHQVDLIAGDFTSGLIVALNLFILEDDRHYFPPYDAAPLVRRATLERHPGLPAALDELGGKISAAEMRQMNYLVDGEHRDAKRVVAEFLKSKGL